MVQFWEYFVLDPDTGEEQQRLMEARMPINKVGVVSSVQLSTNLKILLRHYNNEIGMLFCKDPDQCADKCPNFIHRITIFRSALLSNT